MNAFVLIIGLLTGEVSPEAVEEYVTERTQTVAYAAVTDTRQMTDEQINQTYMTPNGWDQASWAEAVRSIDLRAPAGRRSIN